MHGSECGRGISWCPGISAEVKLRDTVGQVLSDSGERADKELPEIGARLPLLVPRQELPGGGRTGPKHKTVPTLNVRRRGQPYGEQSVGHGEVSRAKRWRRSKNRSREVPSGQLRPPECVHPTQTRAGGPSPLCHLPGPIRSEPPSLSPQPRAPPGGVWKGWVRDGSGMGGEL